jgi:hypothetical protein
MASIPELAAQVDNELSKDLHDTDHLLTLLQQITNQSSTPEGCEDLNDLVFDLVPTLVIAAGKSKACEIAVEHLLEAAAEKCVAREVYSALAAALAESMHNIGIDQTNALGASSLKFQSFLLQKLTSSLLRVKKLSSYLLREHLLLATNWCHCAQEEENGYKDREPNEKCIGEDGFCNAIAPVIEVVAFSKDFTTEERNNAKQIICCSILNVTASALELPSILESAAEAAQSALLEAQSTLSGKLYGFQTLLMELLSGPKNIISLLTKAPPQFGIRNLEDLVDSIHTETHFQGEVLGAAAAVCSSILSTSSSSSAASAVGPACLKCSVSTGKMLQYVSLALNTLTDAASQHHSAPLALLPLLTVSQFARQLGVNKTLLEESYVSVTMPIISTLVAVMSFNPVEIIRTCAYEALHNFLDAMVPQARLLVLQNMTSVSTTNSTVVIAALALQRLRLEISPVVIQAPFTHTTALKLALPWIKQSPQPPGWQTDEDVLQNADVLTAALSVLRFILLQRVAMRRKIVAGEVGQKEQEQGEDETLLGKVPVELQLESLQSLITKHLMPLQACAKSLIRRVKSSVFVKEKYSNEINGELELFLALQRLEEVLERSLEAANELLQKAQLI